MIINFSDTDECLVDIGGCNQTCVNEEGSYHCKCEAGFTVHANEKDCVGMDNPDNCISLNLLLFIL